MAVLTRTQSLSALNALPDQINSIEDLRSALLALRTVLISLELPPSSIGTIAQSDLQGAKLQALLKSFIPKVSAALDANVLHAKGLAKVLGTISAALSFLDSPAFVTSLIEKVVESDLMEELIEAKVREAVEGSGGTRRRRGGGSTSAETSMRAARRMDLEHAVHYVVHRLVNKSYTRLGKAVVSNLTEWPEPEAQGYVEEEVAGSVVRRLRPDWDVSQVGSTFETAVVQMMSDEYGEQFSADDARQALREYAMSISRARKEAESGKQAERKALTNLNKRKTTLLQTMLEAFAGSCLNVCSEREFYLRMIQSKAFQLTTMKFDEPHGFERFQTPASDGEEAKYNAFELMADLWFGNRTNSSTVVAALDVDWWSPKCRRAFWLLYESAKHDGSKKPGAKKTRLPIFHLPTSRRTSSTPASLPRLPVPHVPTDSPATSKKARLETFDLTHGMIDPTILGDNAFDAWSNGLGQDPPKDSNYRELDDVLRDQQYQEIARSAEGHLRVPLECDLDTMRKIWRIRTIGDEGVYLRVIRAEDPMSEAAAVDLQAVEDDFYA